MSISKNHKLLVLAGPTASGKSGLALQLAEDMNGEIVNADAIQLYEDINIISATPSTSEMAIVPHHLYSHIPITGSCSVAEYVEKAANIIKHITSRNKIPILVGGTGMYIKSLCEGMHYIPEISIVVRLDARKKLKDVGKEKFHSILMDLDPESAAKIHPYNSHRLLRAYEVKIATGKSIQEFYLNKPITYLDEYEITTIILEPDRDVLYSRCNQRFLDMIKAGAIEEVENISKKYGNTDASSKAIGFNELKMYIERVISMDDAITLAQARTRQYAKRQMTWFRHQIANSITVPIGGEMPDIKYFKEVIV